MDFELADRYYKEVRWFLHGDKHVKLVTIKIQDNTTHVSLPYKETSCM